MSFIYSLALVEASLQGKCSDIAASVLSSGSPTPPLFLPSDKTTAFSRLSRFGMTFGHLTDAHGEALLTSWLAGFPARTSALPEKAPESTASDPACGPTWRGSLAKFDPATSSWKTAQPSLLADWGESSVTWPRSGMTANGLCWELLMSAPPISATGSGLWPTPTCPNGGRSVAHVTDWRSERTAYTAAGKKFQVDLAQAVKRWPTPVASDTSSRTKPYAQGGTPLSLAVKYQTPVSRMHKDNGKNPSELERNSPTLAMQAGGALNPTWVEWLMGWPLAWTDLKPSETVKSPCALQPPSKCLPELESA